MSIPYIVEGSTLKPYGKPILNEAGNVWKDGRPTVIHSIGDSLTRGQGAESQGGYRIPLRDALVAAGKSVSTTGFRSDIPGPHRWSGEGGWRLRELAHPGTKNKTGLGIVDWVRAYPADIILLHIGTNDLGSGQVSNAVLAEWYGAMLDAMWPYSNKTHVFIAAHLVNLESAWGGTTSYGDAVAAVVQQRIDAGRPYHLVEGMDSISGSANYSDPIHLSAAGYRLMADVWADALLAE